MLVVRPLSEGSSLMDDEITYYPEFGRLLSNGNLLVPTAGRSSSGERFDGRVEVSRDHPSYAMWLERFQDRERYFEDLSNSRRRLLERRREQSRQQLDADDAPSS